MNIQRSYPTTLRQLLYYPVILLTITFTSMPAAYADDVTPPTEITPTTEQTAPADTTTTATAPTPTTEPAPTPESATTTTSPTSTTGPQEPTGADSSSYTYNESTGLWENDKYTWDPVTHQTAPKTSPTYSYNPETGKWDTTEWIWDAPSGSYQPNVISVTSPPPGAIATDGSSDPLPSQEAEKSGVPSTSLMSAASNPTPKDGSTITAKSKSSGFFDMFYNAFISNNISSHAKTGDAAVDFNTLAGNALSGDATAISTVLNLLQSSWGLGLGSNLFNIFTQNLFGDMLGDLWLKPDGTTNGTVSSNTDLAVNVSQNAAIENTITLEATSGDATVAKNTTGGNATTGSATAIANIINAINSSIVSGSSFLGMLNIYGNLDGDILLPDELISTLLAANTMGSLDTSAISNTEVIGDFTSNLGTTNNVNADATSGNATVTHNTTGGNATTGDASTNVTVLNLTGRQVIGKNALLVFVNVLGKWVGMIVDAPAGTTTAAFGGGITENKSLAVSEQNNQQITNDVNVRANSGNALVTDNTTGGDATSGDAHAAVNILNMNMSQFALSDWFGVLFINVFGSWNGSFGIDTAAGSLPPAATAAVQSSTNPYAAVGNAKLTPEKVRAFAFTPHDDGTYTLEQSDDGMAALAAAQVIAPQDSTSNPSEQQASTQEKTEAKPLSPLERFAQRDWTLALVTTTLGLSLLGAERLATRRSHR